MEVDRDNSVSSYDAVAKWLVSCTAAGQDVQLPVQGTLARLADQRCNRWNAGYGG